MPAHRLSSQPIPVHKYDVAGQDSPTSSPFIAHAALFEEQVAGVRLKDEVALVHMGPPLERGRKGIPVHGMGTADLSFDEVRQIAVFVDELASEYEAQRVRGLHQFVILPHAVNVAAPDGTTVYCQFSCAGFVIEAYRDAGIDLLVTDLDRLPPIPLEPLSTAYPREAGHLANPAVRVRLGLAGDGPWPVVLAGYVLNALARSEGDIRGGPYIAVAGDEFFPSRSERT